MTGSLGRRCRARAQTATATFARGGARAHGGSTRYDRGTLLHPYTRKMSVHLPDRRPPRFLGRATARHRIGQPVLLFAKVQKKRKIGKNNFIVYFSDIFVYFSSGCAGDTGLYADKISVHLRVCAHPDLWGVRHRGSGSGNLYNCLQSSNRKIGKMLCIVYFSEVCR
jgi:hypothetical protein